MLLTESSHVSFVYEENECSLVVLSTGAQDGGVYTCTARNLAGEVFCKAELAVRSGGLALKGRRAECSPPGIRCEPLARSHSSGPAFLGSHIFQPRHPTSGFLHSCSSLSPPSALPVSVSALIPPLPFPSNTRYFFRSSDSYGGGRGRRRRGAARKETQRLL